MTTSLRHLTTTNAVANPNTNQDMSSHSNLKNQFTIDKRRSPQMKSRTKILPTAANASDSEGSAESNSLSAESNHEQVAKIQASKEIASKRVNRRGSEWEILEGLKDGQRFEKKPEILTGYLHKKRKWPLKGWHKRYFVVDKGILIYGKSPGDIAKGKVHGSVDIGLSVISTKTKRRRLDIDAEEFIYHLKAKQVDVFRQWIDQLKQHRLYRQHVLTYGGHSDHRSPNVESQRDSGGHATPVVASHHRKLTMSPPELGLTRENSVKQCSGIPRLAAWLLDANPPLDLVVRELSQVQQNINQLSQILVQLESASCAEAESGVTGDGFSPNVKKDRKKFGLRKKKSGKGSSVDLSAGSSPNKPCLENSESPSPLSSCSFTGGLSTSPGATTALSCSNPSLATAGVIRPQSLSGSGADHHPLLTPDSQLHSDFTILAKDIHSNLKSIFYTLSSERDRLKTALDVESSTAGVTGPVTGSGAAASNSNTASVIVATLRHTLHQTLQQNADLKARLNRIHEASDLTDISEAKPLQQSLSYSSSCISASEFFDAEDYEGGEVEEEEEEEVEEAAALGVANLPRGAAANSGAGGGVSDTSSEAGSLTSEDGSVVSSENSEMGGSEYNPAQNVGCPGNGSNMTGRRTKLPAPRPNTEGLSLWNLLCKNIGKDLSQVSMPVALNEPLNMLQRLCEELEYSELLDKASELSDPYERMVYVAAFAVSSYGSSYFRAGSKPFNPLLGETYECIREDKGFKFIAEQVSHHPPVSVCFAESKNFEFWQDARIKTKFWGKSMEFQPTGFVNVKLQRPDGSGKDHYRWNKVTTCVHNLFGGQRWVDQYGELRITTQKISCKLTFVKASYWSAKRHEVHGVVINEDDGKVMRNLFGKWSEAFYCGVAPSAKCIWRPGTMPEDYEMYYGFTRFAMELNELDSEMAKYLPSTDTRFRPDQRLLEEGNLNAAESLKLQLEQAQRDRRKRHEQEGTTHDPKWFSKTTQNGEEQWEYNNKYWETRKAPGFVNMSFEPLW
ncbi:hypothetical protein LSTR_LSTR011515 [Laodelphax striatellus]|uniref:PH domain-containing protein n=1 Tax=Laodelphax striatellus TaxID=195883 RepID=A0A482WFH3_LAOST|nr:hypothetical protein LSTR_LSTR011515 [Laodelphax striatellus]